MDNPIEEFTKSKWNFKIVGYRFPWCIYKRSRNNRTTHYEVVKISFVKEDVFSNGIQFARKGSMMYPSNESWGKTAFTFKTFDKAINKFSQKIKEQ